MSQKPIMNMEELITQIDKDNLILYLGDGASMEANVEKRIVLFTHDAQWSGALSALFDMSNVLIECGYTVFLVSPEESELLVDFILKGVHVIVYERYQKDPEWIMKVAEVFPKVFVNTLYLTNLSTFLAPIANKLYWWIHETKSVIEDSVDVLMKVPIVPSLQVLSASPLIKRCLEEYANLESELLDFCICDDLVAAISKLNDKMDINPKMNQCTGCGACKLVCPAQAITMEKNQKGFEYPVINEAKCIECRKCVAACPVNERTVYETTNTFWAFKRKDVNKLMESQSGGAFSVFAEDVLAEGGVVYGVTLNEENKAVYIRVDKVEDLIKIKGSKYVQANLNNTYECIKEDLKIRKVLFSGTPCYVAGLNQYLRNENTENLLTCDLICHGVPSPALFEDHLAFLESQNKKPITDFNFRNKKSFGWHSHVETYTNKSGQVVEDSSYVSIFYTDACLRESCYSCNYANTERVADITIGDFWGVEKVFPDMDDNRGISLVLINSEKGQVFFEKVSKSADVEIWKTDFESCVQRNLVTPTPRPSITEQLWRDYREVAYKKMYRKYGQVRLYDFPNRAVLKCWQEKLEKGERLAGILKERGIENVLVCGSRENNQLVIMELRKGEVNVLGELKLAYGEVAGVVPCIELKEWTHDFEEKVDTILVTNESDMVDVLTELHSANVPMEKITPLSFVLDEEV